MRIELKNEVIETEYDIYDEVYLKTDQEQSLRLVTGVLIYPGCIMYALSCGIDTTTHYEKEISKEKTYEFLTGSN